MNDWTAELDGSFTMGAGTAYPFTGPIEGLGVPRPRTYDTPNGASPGDTAPADIPARRVIIIPVAILGDGTDDCWGKVTALNEAWAPRAADVTLDIGLGGVTTRYSGRPRFVDLRLDDLKDGIAAAQLTFEALNPAGTVMEGP